MDAECARDIPRPFDCDWIKVNSMGRAPVVIGRGIHQPPRAASDIEKTRPRPKESDQRRIGLKRIGAPDDLGMRTRIGSVVERQSLVERQYVLPCPALFHGKSRFEQFHVLAAWSTRLGRTPDSRPTNARLFACFATR